MKTNKMTITDFIKSFSDEKSCREHLCNLKWGSGYECRKCGHQKAVKGRTWYYRKCQKCHYDESCTSNTLFHKVKFPLDQAFLMMYLITTHKKGISTCELSRQFGVKQQTAWFFKRKVQQAMKPTGLHLLDGLVEVDETAIGGRERGKQGRSHGKKKIVQVAVQTAKNSKGEKIIKRAYAKVIDSYASHALKQGIQSMVQQGATIRTDKWSSYPAATINFDHIQEYSEQGSNFELLHWHIFNIKNWIRGTHHHLSSDHAQKYLDEFHFRFNRRNQRKSITFTILKRMIESPWLPYNKVVGK